MSQRTIPDSLAPFPWRACIRRLIRALYWLLGLLIMLLLLSGMMLWFNAHCTRLSAVSVYAAYERRSGQIASAEIDINE
jgi:hypothetical protein